MTAVSRAASPSPSGSPAFELLTNGLSTAELWALVWPALAGALLLAVGAAAAVGYIHRWLTSDWPPHWTRGAFGLVLMAASAPVFLIFAHRVESEATTRGLPVLTFLLVVAAQLGVLDDNGGRRRRRR